MKEFSRELLPFDIETIMRRSYLDYAMSVIVGRALPDIRDGLKPVHRRSLYAMKQLGNYWNKPYKKSARVVGDVIGKYHPHGDTAVYEAIVRMAQSFSMRYPLVDGQGNFGSIDGDTPAAMRYTEVRMENITAELLADIDEETVDTQQNYDGTELEPSVLPTRLPNLLINGSSGIAVAMATTIPPHNLGESLSAVVACLDNPEISLDELIGKLPGPDFPTGGIICGRSSIRQAYETGSGIIVVRSRCHFEDMKTSGRTCIVVSELPYTVNKARLVTRIAELVRSKSITGISNLRDESNKEGIRVVIEVGQGEIPEVILNRLYVSSQLQISYPVNMVAVANRRPIIANLKTLIEHFLEHRRDVVVRRTIFQLRKARQKAHILEGQAVALHSIDEVIALIKGSETPNVAKELLLARSWLQGVAMEMASMESGGDAASADLAKPEGLPEHCGLRGGEYYLSEEQALNILAMRLHRLTALEKDKLISSYRELRALIVELDSILADADKLNSIIREELEEVKKLYADPRRTEIVDADADFCEEDFITQEKLVITLSQEGYAKSQAIANFTSQHRGGLGVSATNVKAGDWVKIALMSDSHDTLMCFTNTGKVYWIKAYQLPRAGRAAKGKPIINLLRLAAGEVISAIVPVLDYQQDRYLVLATAKGVIKKTLLEYFSRPKSSGVRAIVLDKDDKVVGAKIGAPDRHFVLATSDGRCMRFDGDKIRTIGRVTRGVRGVRLAPESRVVSLLCFAPDDGENTAVFVTNQGVGKRVELSLFTVRNRGGKGMLAIKMRANGEFLVGAELARQNEDIVLVTSTGSLIRFPAVSVALLKRYARGVKLKRIEGEDNIVGMFSLPAPIDDEQAEDEKNPLDSAC